VVTLDPVTSETVSAEAVSAEAVSAETDPSTVDAPIVSVTVYPDRARVTRRGTVRLTAGRHRVHIEPLPLRLLADSIRVGGHGPATVLGVDVLRRSHPRPPDSAVAELQRRRRELAGELAALDDADRAQAQHAEFITALGQRSAGTFARALASGEADAAGIATFAELLTGQLTQVQARRRDLTARRHLISEDINALDRTLTDLGTSVRPDRMAAAVDLEVDATGEVALELSYVVDSAGWSSTYDLRVDGERLALSWYGLITQRTGEDWPECDLLLSTARPSDAASVPELDPWYLDRRQPVVRGSVYGSPSGPSGYGAPGGAPMMPGAPVPAPAFAARDVGAQPPPPPPPPPIQESTAAIEQGVSAATYRSARPVAVPADGATHRATVAAVDLTAKLDYVTAPVRVPEAHLRATVVNGSDHTLLPGPAAVFSGGDFVGNAALEMWAPGEQIELALGVDDRVRVERELVGRRATKATLGSTRRREVEYRTTVANHTPQPAEVTVLDQLPVSRDDGITVKESRLSPQPVERTELGVLTWKLTLAPGASAEILLGMRVEVSKGVDMTGWRE
jgi:uncharacterized protein (TIGR02231 family)